VHLLVSSKKNKIIYHIKLRAFPIESGALNCIGAKANIIFGFVFFSRGLTNILPIFQVFEIFLAHFFFYFFGRICQMALEKCRKNSQKAKKSGAN